MKKAYLKYLIALLLFGTNGIVASFISLTSCEIVLLRTFIGSLLLVVIFNLTKGKSTFLKNRRHFLFLVFSGAAMGASWMFLYEAYQQIGVSVASLVYYCGPVIVMALSTALFREKMTWAKATAFLTVLFGVFLINMQATWRGKSGWGLFCGGMSAVLYAVMVIFNKKACSVTGLENSMLQLAVSFLTVAVFVGVKQGFAIELAAGDYLPVLLLGLLNTGLGCYFYFSSIGSLPVQTVAVLGYLEPLSAVVFSVLFLREAMGVVQVLGAILILGGAVFGECAARRYRKPKRNLGGCKRWLMKR